jgi:tetratricopeptide (TPR) repeat protein
LPQLGLANLAAAAGDWTEAERGYRAALAADPANVAAQNNRAEALRQMGCLDAADDTLELALAQAPRDHPLYGALQATAAGVAAARTPTRADAPACGPLAAAAAPGTPLP